MEGEWKALSLLAIIVLLIGFVGCSGVTGDTNRKYNSEDIQFLYERSDLVVSAKISNVKEKTPKTFGEPIGEEETVGFTTPCIIYNAEIMNNIKNITSLKDFEFILPDYYINGISKASVELGEEYVLFLQKYNNSDKAYYPVDISKVFSKSEFDELRRHVKG